MSKYNIKVVNRGWFTKGHKPVAPSHPNWMKVRGIKGVHFSPNTEFTTERVSGEKNNNWLGDDVGYFGVHSWIYKKLGKAKVCSRCKSSQNVQWANISKKYKRNTSDWKQLCCVCHRRFDGLTKLSKKQANELKRKYYKEGKTQTKLAIEFNLTQSAISRIVNGRIQFYG